MVLLTIVVLTSFNSPVCADTIKVPPQYFYNKSNVAHEEEKDGCVIRQWDGTDAHSVTGYPWITSIECKKDATFTDTGMNAHGQLMVYLRDGSLSVFGPTDAALIVDMGSAVWIQEGIWIHMTLKGSAYIVGAYYELVNLPQALPSASYLAPTLRAYQISEGVLHQDSHVNNGTAHAHDLTWSSNSTVDPPNILVMICETDAWVDYHFHPQGALYIPFAGSLCFQTQETQCIKPGELRWTSPVLWYYEPFKMLDVTNPEADRLFKTLGLSCDLNPIVFSVNNFNAGVNAGVPNFEGAPPKKMIVRNTLVQSNVVTLEDSYHAEL